MGQVYGRMNFANMPRFSSSGQYVITTNSSQLGSSISGNPSKARPECRGPDQKHQLSSFVSSTVSRGSLDVSGSAQASSTASLRARASGGDRSSRGGAASTQNAAVLLNRLGTLRRSARLSGTGPQSRGVARTEIQSTLRRSARIAGVRGGPSRRSAPVRRGQGARVRTTSEQAHERNEGVRRSLRLQQRRQQF